MNNNKPTIASPYSPIISFHPSRSSRMEAPPLPMFLPLRCTFPVVLGWSTMLSFSICFDSFVTVVRYYIPIIVVAAVAAGMFSSTRLLLTARFGLTNNLGFIVRA